MANYIHKNYFDFMNYNSSFNWQRCPEAESLIEQALDKTLQKNPELRSLQKKLLKHTSSRLFDWLDYVVVGTSQEASIDSTGFKLVHADTQYRLYAHPGAQLPMIVLKEEDEAFGAAVLVESIEKYLLVEGLGGEILGSFFSPYRKSLISSGEEAPFWIVERREGGMIEPITTDEKAIVRYLKAKELWSLRARSQDDEMDAFRTAQEVAKDMVSLVGESLAAGIVMEVEREVWQTRNRAGQVQKARQDFVGMGWANHDHHTFRSSRKHFRDLVKLLEILGFRVRERFYAGEEAGWGAQVMEHPKVRLVMFLDVDLLPEELELDFSHHPLPPTPKLGTIGLWCALHGDSILHSGMHHLEAQFMFEELREDLKQSGVAMMEPFSNFEYLKQAFTKGEMWEVNPTRVENLYKKGLISEDQKKRFLEKGALGSHMENLQRREGYKGFNQKNVSFIIKKTDPRHEAS